MKTALIHARIEPETKKRAEIVLDRLGMTPTEAIRLFYHQISLRKGLPFSVEIPNELTAHTLHNSSKGKDIQNFENLDDLFASWNK
ncbi:MAG TPA: type II toxin-antitoxin system RelB/DinJ family antitoxin [Kiritimatiellia bacterium]|nr:type II toxin-antitoxin system RelB/DinJ family antitoxin [Kiritimatiellia bacterium]HNS81476.1 type II toxin-antitoxin system RelB/DinJ family antitoxin [Kiritimatiellia bacterium]